MTATDELALPRTSQLQFAQDRGCAAAPSLETTGDYDSALQFAPPALAPRDVHWFAATAEAVARQRNLRPNDVFRRSEHHQ
jgi:hypothetical protein